MLKWLGHVERMEEERRIKRIYRSKVEAERLKGRPRKGNVKWLLADIKP